MINYNKNKLINRALDEYYNTFSHTLDTADFVPDRFTKKIHKYIFKNMKKALKKVDKEDRKYQKEQLKLIKLKAKQAKPPKQKHSLFNWLKRLFKLKKQSSNGNLDAFSTAPEEFD